MDGQDSLGWEMVANANRRLACGFGREMPSSVWAFLTLVLLVTAGCTTASNAQHSSAKPPPASPSPVVSEASTYGPVPPLVDSKTAGEAILRPANFQLTCSEDICTVAGELLNVGDHPRTSGKMTATLVDAGSGSVLSGCEAVARNLNPGDAAAISCNFSRRPLLKQASLTAEVRFEIAGISYGL
jgi:hypothetical protein